MAVSSSTVLSRPTTFIANVTATADADTVININHGLISAPNDVTLTNINVQAAAALSAWCVTDITATQVQLTKSTAVGSGNATAQLRVTASLPHSIV